MTKVKGLTTGSRLSTPASLGRMSKTNRAYATNTNACSKRVHTREFVYFYVRGPCGLSRPPFECTHGTGCGRPGYFTSALHLKAARECTCFSVRHCGSRQGPPDRPPSSDPAPRYHSGSTGMGSITTFPTTLNSAKSPSYTAKRKRAFCGRLNVTSPSLSTIAPSFSSRVSLALR